MNFNSKRILIDEEFSFEDRKSIYSYLNQGMKILDQFNENKSNDKILKLMKEFLSNEERNSYLNSLDKS